MGTGIVTWLRGLLRYGPPPWRATADGVDIDVPGIGRLDIRLHPSGDRWISDPLRQGNVLEPYVLAVLRDLVRPGDTMLDVGGNIGWFTVIGSRLVGPQGRVVAVEPERGNAALVRDNIARNGCGNAELFEIAAGAVEATARLYRSPDNSGDHQMAVASDRAAWVDVTVRPLDAVVSTKVDVVKMDTQGSEVLALRGMRGMLAANPAMRMVLEFWPHGLAQCGCTTAEFMALLAGHPRVIWLMDVRGVITHVTPERLVALAEGAYAPATQAHGDIIVVAANDAEAISRIAAREKR